MILRPATPADVPAILKIWNPVIRDTLFVFSTTEKTAADIRVMIERHATAGHATLVADIDDAVAGIAAYAPLRPGPGYLRTPELSVHVHPDRRGAGVGRALVGALCDHAQAEHAGSLWAGISGANPGALAFHGRLGFAPAAILPRTGWKHDRWLDLHMMVKWLAARDNPADTVARAG